MAHYALLDENNFVTQVIVGKNENDVNMDWEKYYELIYKKKCKRTSYNTIANTHRLGGTPFRKNYAGIGFYYDEQRDAFIPPKPYDSWILNDQTCLWDPPVDMPVDGNDYFWNQETNSWEIVSNF